MELSTSVGLCRGKGSMLKSPWMGSMVLSSTLKRKKINPYRAGPRPLHSPLMPVIIPWTTPAGHVISHVTGDTAVIAAHTSNTDFAARVGNTNFWKICNNKVTYWCEEEEDREEERFTLFIRICRLWHQSRDSWEGDGGHGCYSTSRPHHPVNTHTHTLGCERTGHYPSTQQWWQTTQQKMVNSDHSSSVSISNIWNVTQHQNF